MDWSKLNCKIHWTNYIFVCNSINLMKKVFFSLLIFTTIASCSLASSAIQAYDLYNNDTINIIDANNFKQGKWVYFGKDKNLPSYESSQIVEEGEYIDNRKMGIWKKYFPNGKLQNEITYKSGRPNGHAKIYYKNGNLKEEGLWKSNKWIGNYKYYYENGNLYHEFAYSDRGKRSGPQKYYYETGQVMIEGEWEEGKEAGVIKEYYEDGSIKAEKFFNNGSLDPEKTIVFEKEEPEVIPDPEPEGKGVVVEKGEVTRTVEPFNGTGYHKLYNKNRQISKDGIFKNYKLKDGKWYRYNKDGILLKIEVYKKGKYIGDAQIEEE